VDRGRSPHPDVHQELGPHRVVRFLEVLRRVADERQALPGADRADRQVDEDRGDAIAKAGLILGANGDGNHGPKGPLAGRLATGAAPRRSIRLGSASGTHSGGVRICVSGVKSNMVEAMSMAARPSTMA